MKRVMLAAASLALVAWLSPRIVDACGPFFLRTVFTFAKHPDFPLETFASGRVGVVQPTWARSQRLVAYRYLSGRPLSDAEQKSASAVWRARLQQDQSLLGPGQTGAPDSPWDYPAEWLKARSSVPGAAAITAIAVFRDIAAPQAFGSYLNCTSDAFTTAAATLQARIAAFGAESGAVADWLRAQDQVFANCESGRTIPSAALAGSPKLLQQDREYQIAAAYFYAGDFADAEKLFTAIGQDAASPWQPLARYLAVRAIVRQATLAKSAGVDLAILARAEAALKNLPSHPATQGAQARLTSFIDVRLHSVERIRDLATRLQTGTSQWSPQDLWDYTTLLDALPQSEASASTEAAEIAFTQTTAVRASSDLTDWLMTIENRGPSAERHAVDRWRTTRSAPWLVAALVRADPRGPDTSMLLEAAHALAADSPAFPSALFHSARVLIALNQPDAARAAIDAALANGEPAWPRSTLNAIRATRMTLARTLDEFLRFAPRTPAGVTYDEDDREMPADQIYPPELGLSPRLKTTVGADAAEALNARFPLAVLKDAAASSSLPEHIRRDAALAGWVRALLIENDAVAREFATQAIAVAPDLQKTLAPYVDAADPQARARAGLFVILRNPGMRPTVDEGTGRRTPLDRIDDYRDNWWCGAAASTNQSSSPLGDREQPPPNDPGPLPFLTPEQRAAASAERTKIAALDAAPNYLTARVVDWARQAPADPRVPEALHLAVRSTRFGCTTDDTTKFSRAAFTVLHQKYPTSEWTKRTPYYY